jgi:DNA (cytosine-5)-methyltransferase 1
MATALGWPSPAITYTNAQTNSGRRPRGLSRPLSAPARTLDTSAGAWTIEPIEADDPPPPDGFDRRWGDARVRPTSSPAPTLTAAGLAHSGPRWAWLRPATTVLCDPRIQPPGHKRNSSDPPGRYRSRAGREAVRITERQAAVLQGFRAEYPWQGSRSRRFAQIGNAVCPPVAQAVLGEAIRPSIRPPER